MRKNFPQPHNLTGSETNEIGTILLFQKILSQGENVANAFVGFFRSCLQTHSLEQQEDGSASRPGLAAQTKQPSFQTAVYLSRLACPHGVHGPELSVRQASMWKDPPFKPPEPCAEPRPTPARGLLYRSSESTRLGLSDTVKSSHRWRGNLWASVELSVGLCDSVVCVPSGPALRLQTLPTPACLRVSQPGHVVCLVIHPTGVHGWISHHWMPRSFRHQPPEQMSQFTDTLAP